MCTLKELIYLEDISAKRERLHMKVRKKEKPKLTSNFVLVHFVQLFKIPQTGFWSPGISISRKTESGEVFLLYYSMADGRKARE
jgi:hypothetical protein